MLKSRFDDHLSRKLFHLFSGTLIAYLFVSVFDRWDALLWLSVAFLLSLPFELGRFISPSISNLVMKSMGSLMRQNEKNEPSAQFFYFIGLIFSVALLPRVLAIQSILILAWMDPIAGLVGVRYGKRGWSELFSNFMVGGRKIPIDFGGKTLEGSFAGFCAAFAAGTVAWTGPWAQYVVDGAKVWPSAKMVFVFSLIGAIVAVIAEAWPSQWDDNAKIPVWCGIVLITISSIWALPLEY